MRYEHEIKKLTQDERAIIDNILGDIKKVDTTNPNSVEIDKKTSIVNSKDLKDNWSLSYHNFNVQKAHLIKRISNMQSAEQVLEFLKKIVTLGEDYKGFTRHHNYMNFHPIFLNRVREILGIAIKEGKMADIFKNDIIEENTEDEPIESVESTEDEPIELVESVEDEPEEVIEESKEDEPTEVLEESIFEDKEPLYEIGQYNNQKLDVHIEEFKKLLSGGDVAKETDRVKSVAFYIATGIDLREPYVTEFLKKVEEFDFIEASISDLAIYIMIISRFDAPVYIEYARKLANGWKNFCTKNKCSLDQIFFLINSYGIKPLKDKSGKRKSFASKKWLDRISEMNLMYFRVEKG